MKCYRLQYNLKTKLSKLKFLKLRNFCLLSTRIVFKAEIANYSTQFLNVYLFLIIPNFLASL